MRAAALLALGLAACPKPSATATGPVDASLPESSTAALDPAATVQNARTSADESRRSLAYSVSATGDGADLVAGLADDSPYVVRAAAHALVARGDRAALQALAGDTSADMAARSEAAVALGGPDARAALGDAPSGVIDELYWALAAARLGDADARARLERALAHGDLPLELDLFRRLGASPDPGLATALAAAQPNVESELAATLAATRLALGDDSAAPVLHHTLADPDEEVRLEVLDLLADVPGPAAARLIAHAERDRSPFVAAYAGMLSAAREDRDGRAFVDAMESTEWELRQLSVRILSASADPSSRQLERVLKLGLADANPSVRAEAAAGAAKVPAVEPELRALLADPSDLVSLHAALSLLGRTSPAP